jgi:hypothetical protein
VTIGSSGPPGGWSPSPRSVALWTVIAGIAAVLSLAYAVVHNWNSSDRSETATSAITAVTTPAVSAPPTSETEPAKTSGTAAATYLTDLEPVGGDYLFDEKGPLAIDGKIYSHAIGLAADDEPHMVEYNLGKRYNTFSVVLGLRDDASEEEGPSACHWRILADSRELASGDTWRGHHLKIGPKNIRGVVHLRIEAIQTKGNKNPVPWPCTAGDPQVA